MLRPAPQIAAGSVPVPVEVLAGVALVHAQAAVQVAEVVLAAAAEAVPAVQEAAQAPALAAVLASAILPVRPKRRQN